MVDVADGRKLTATELREQYVAKNRPVILRGAASRWASGELWTEAYLRQRCGERTLTVRSAESATFHGETGYATATLTVNELLDAIGSTSPVGALLPYAAQVPLRTALPELDADARPPPAHLAALGARLRGAPAAYIGGGSRTPLHFDALENLLVVVRGRKDVTLWHPQHSALLYPRDDGAAAIFSRADIYHPDFDAFPLLRDALPLGLRAELAAGDALYLPRRWWHAVKSPSGQLNVSLSYWTQPVDEGDGGASVT
jgi:hypothetical protein